MKHFGVVMICFTLLCAMFSPLPSLTTSGLAEEALPEAEGTAAYNRQVIIVPSVTKDYASMDKEGLFLQTLKDALRLKPSDESMRALLFSSLSKTPYETTDMSRAAINLDFPSPTKDKALIEQLELVKSTYLQEADKTVLIAIDSMKAQKESVIEKKWALLRTLSQSGVDVYLIGLRTSKNDKTEKMFSSWLNDGQEDASFAPDSVRNYSDRLHFLWIQDYEHAPSMLLPMIGSMVGQEFMKVQTDAEGNYTVHPYATMTEQTMFLLEGNLMQRAPILLNANGEEMTYTPVVNGATMNVLTVDDPGETLTVCGMQGLTSVAWSAVHMKMDGIQLSFANRDGKSEFRRNEKATFYASLQGVDDVASFANDMRSHGSMVCEMYDTSTDTIVSTMVYDEDAKAFKAECAFQSSCEGKSLAARIRRDDETVLKSAPAVIRVSNEKPVLQTGDASIYWIDDPWEKASNKELHIPCSAVDADGDALTISLLEPEEGGLVNGLGAVTLADNDIVVALNDQPQTGREFSIRLSCNDGETESEPATLTFALYSLREQMLGLREAVELSASPSDKVSRNAEFTADVTVKLPRSLSDDIRQKLAATLGERCKWVLHMLSEGNEQTIAMNYDNGWRCTGRIERSGTYTLRADCITGTDAFSMNSVSQSIEVEGTAPKLNKENAPEKEISAVMQGDSIDTEVWHMPALVASKLFADAEDDEITITVTATRRTSSESEQQTVLSAAASGDEAANLSFTVAGTYDVVITSEDADGKGDSINCTVSIASAFALWHQRVMLTAAASLTALFLILLIAWLAKPSFKGKLIMVKISSQKWQHTCRVYSDSWKKKKQPMHLLLTSAACPPDRQLYAALEKAEIKPLRHGILLLGLHAQGLGDKVRVRENESIRFNVNQYTLELVVYNQKDM